MQTIDQLDRFVQGRARGRLVAVGQDERQECPGAGLLSGLLQSGDDPSRPVRIGLRQAPAEPQGDLSPCVGRADVRRIIDELEDTLRFGRMLARQRFGNRDVAGLAARGVADVPDEGQDPIELEPRRGRQEYSSVYAGPVAAPRAVPSLRGSAGGPSRPRRGPANHRRLVPAGRAGFEARPRARHPRARGLEPWRAPAARASDRAPRPARPRPTTRNPVRASPGLADRGDDRFGLHGIGGKQLRGDPVSEAGGEPGILEGVFLEQFEHPGGVDLAHECGDNSTGNCRCPFPARLASTARARAGPGLATPPSGSGPAGAPSYGRTVRSSG